MHELLALLLAISLPLAPTPVFRCTSATGDVSYQDMPCSRDEASVEIEMAPIPDYAPPRQSDQEAASGAARELTERPLLPPLQREEPRSWRCIADNGEVFYRHDGCPSTISIVMLDPYAQAYANAALVYVQSIPIRRSEACAAISASGRFGSERDQRAAPYEKLTGRDLCR